MVVVLRLGVLGADLGIVAESKHYASVHRWLHQNVKRHLHIFSYELLFDESKTSIHLRPEVDLLRSCTALDIVFQSGDFTNLLVPALDQVVEPVHKLRVVLNAVIKITNLHVCTMLGGIIELSLDLRINCEFDHGDFHILARLWKMDLEKVEAFDDAIETSRCTLWLVTACISDLSLVLVILEKGHERKVYVCRSQLEDVWILAQVAKVDDLDLRGKVASFLARCLRAVGWGDSSIEYLLDVHACR